MSKKQIEGRELEKIRAGVTSEYVCPCPECGCVELSFRTKYEGDSFFPESIDIMCPHCGMSTVRHVEGPLEWVTEDGAPYFPEIEDISITRYHRFDPLSFESEEDAIRCEMELIEDAKALYRDFGEEEMVDSLEDRADVLAGRACEIGMTDYIWRHVLDLIATAFDEGGDVDEAIDKSIILMESACMKDVITVLTVMYGQDADYPKLSRFIDSLKDILIKIACNAEVPETRVAKLVMAHLVFKELGLPDADPALDMAFDGVSEIKDPEEHTSALLTLYGCDITRLGKGERLEMEVDFIGEHLEEEPWVHAMSVIHYGEVMYNDCPDRVMTMTDRSLAFLEMELDKSLEDADYDKDVDWFLAKTHHLRYRINGSPEELAIAAESALSSAIVNGSEDSVELLKECLDDPRMPRGKRREILATAKKTEVL